MGKNSAEEHYKRSFMENAGLQVCSVLSEIAWQNVNRLAKNDILVSSSD